MRLMLAILVPMLLALPSANAQTIVYQGTKTTFKVVQVPGNSYYWELYDDAGLNFALAPGNCPASAARFTAGNTGSSVEVEWLQPGIYFYKITAKDAGECTNNLKVGMIKVIPEDVIAVNTGPAQNGACQQIALDASSSKGKIISYEWTILDPGIVLTSPNSVSTTLSLSPSFTGALPADFRVRLRVTDQDGKSDSDTITVRIDPMPVATIYCDNRPERDGSMVVDGSVSSGVGLNYRWSTVDGKIVGPADLPAANLLGAGMYTLAVTDMFGCQSTKTFRFPIDLYQINANPDYAKTTWAHDTTIYVLNNDLGTAPLIPSSVRIIQTPQHGKTRINTDGSILYIPDGKVIGRDQFIYEVCDAVNLCDSAVVTVQITEEKITIPEAFSPNGDGQNDLFIFNGLEQYPQSRLYIYTRSGQLIYETKDYRNNWDGKPNVGSMSNSKLVPTGVYYYILELGGTTKTVKGFIYVGY